MKFNETFGKSEDEFLNFSAWIPMSIPSGEVQYATPIWTPGQADAFADAVVRTLEDAASAAA